MHLVDYNERMWKDSRSFLNLVNKKKTRIENYLYLITNEHH
jgi:hypothetical protein